MSETEQNTGGGSTPAVMRFYLVNTKETGKLRDLQGLTALDNELPFLGRKNAKAELREVNLKTFFMIKRLPNTFLRGKSNSCNVLMSTRL